MLHNKKSHICFDYGSFCFNKKKCSTLETNWFYWFTFLFFFFMQLSDSMSFTRTPWNTTEQKINSKESKATQVTPKEHKLLYRNRNQCVSKLNNTFIHRILKDQTLKWISVGYLCTTSTLQYEEFQTMTHIDDSFDTVVEVLIFNLKAEIGDWL